MVEHNYQTLQEEVEDMRKLIKNFRIRYKQAVTEIKDLNIEHARERGDLFESVQTFERESNLYKSILRQLLDISEIGKVEAKCVYDQDNKQW